MSKKEVAVTEEKKFELVTLSGEFAAAIAEEMDGLGSIPYDKVKIPSGGGLAFEVPGEDEDNPESATALEGIIVDHHPVNAYWKDEYVGGNEQPDCSSFDGKEGIVSETGEIIECATCPFNQFGSDGKGKACKNLHRCYILREGDPVPLLLTLPPTSLRYLRDYIGKKVLLRGKRCWEVITRITLKKEKSGGGIIYSRTAFTYVGDLDPQQSIETKAMADTLKLTKKAVEVDTSDYEKPAKSAEAAEERQAAEEVQTEFQKIDENEFEEVEGAKA